MERIYRGGGSGEGRRPGLFQAKRTSKARDEGGPVGKKHGDRSVQAAISMQVLQALTITEAAGKTPGNQGPPLSMRGGPVIVFNGGLR